jgi:F-type H+-transporting ATPase subunit O
MAARPSVRTFATDAAHKPPLDLYGLHARYANATYVAASKAGTLDKVETELLALKQTAASTPAFASFLENPLISRDAKEKQIKSLLAKKTTLTTLNLMTTLAGNARLAEMPKIAETFEKLMKAKRGQVEAVIISAEPLTKQQTDAVTAAMKSQVEKGQQVVLSTKVDPSIVGGLQVQIGDQFLDLSVSSRIDEIGRISV